MALMTRARGHSFWRQLESRVVAVNPGIDMKNRPQVLTRECVSKGLAVGGVPWRDL